MGQYWSPFEAKNGQFSHSSLERGPRVGVLLIQLGTPEQPSAAAVKPYLLQFLSDPRVVEIPRLIWQVILRGIILNTRPSKSAKKYASIWTENGSPLLVHSQAQLQAVQSVLAANHVHAQVVLAMRYARQSNPLAIRQALRGLAQQGVDHILVVPMYPQYAAATTASSFDAVFDELKGWRNVPALRLTRHFHDQEFYIQALTDSVRQHWQANGQGDHLLMSFHGVPERSLHLGDPYYCECQKTGRLLAQALGLTPDQYSISFQSRFGKAKWLEPYTSATLVRLAGKGVKKLDVICPGFVADCLETLEEIAQEAAHDFAAAGGQEFRYIACLNKNPAFTRGLSDFIASQLGGWPTGLPSRGAD